MGERDFTQHFSIAFRHSVRSLIKVIHFEYSFVLGMGSLDLDLKHSDTPVVVRICDAILVFNVL
jgi:hypothetical protein